MLSATIRKLLNAANLDLDEFIRLSALSPELVIDMVTNNNCHIDDITEKRVADFFCISLKQFRGQEILKLNGFYNPHPDSYQDVPIVPISYLNNIKYYLDNINFEKWQYWGKTPEVISSSCFAIRPRKILDNAPLGTVFFVDTNLSRQYFNSVLINHAKHGLCCIWAHALNQHYTLDDHKAAHLPVGPYEIMGVIIDRDNSPFALSMKWE